jgi:hypothetical protein
MDISGYEIFWLIYAAVIVVLWLTCGISFFVGGLIVGLLLDDLLTLLFRTSRVTHVRRP